MHVPVYRSSKPSTIRASVLHGPQDLRLVSTIHQTRGPGRMAGPLEASLVTNRANKSYCTLQETRSIEEPRIGELQIAIKTTGICGSDVSYYKRFANGDLCACHPLSLGHESAGEVVAIGQQVQGFKLGDRVALEVGVPCDQCGFCRKGRYNLCKKLRFRSSAKSYPHYQGTLQERINHPAAWCHK